MRKASLIALIPVLAALAGCNMAPRYVRPEMPVAAAFPEAAAAGPEAGVAADVAWRDFFIDERLRGLIALGLENNRDLRVAIGNVEQARALYRVQRADLLPTLGVNGSATYQKAPVIQGLPTGGNGRADIYSVNLGITAWEIDLFGRIRNLSDAALQRFLAARETQDAAQVALIAEIANAYLTLAADQDRLRIALDTQKAFGATAELTRARFARGIASELDVSQAQTSLDQARSDAAALETLVAQDRNALTLLVGSDPSSDLLPQGMADGGSTLGALPAGLPSDVLLRRPDIASAERTLRAANADIGAARAAFLPRLSLTAAAGTMSLGLSSLFANGSESWSVAPSATLPIFDFGRNKGNLRYAEASQKVAVAQYEKAVQTGFREVADALARRATIDTQVSAQQSLRENAAKAYALSDARYRSGIEPFLTTLDSQRSLYTAEQSLVATRLARETNLVALYRSLGGGLK